MSSAYRAPGFGWLAALALLLLIAGSVQIPSLGAPYVGSDLASFDAVGQRPLTQVVRLPDPAHDGFRPVGVQLYFALVTRLGGSPVAAHAFNLALLLMALALFGWVASLLCGLYPAIIAVALLASSYAVDVPVLWASGAPWLVALVWSLAAIGLHRVGLRVPAAIALFLALLSHESALFAVIVAIAVSRRPREFLSDTLQNAMPLFAAVVAWGLLWLAALMRHDFQPHGLRGFHPSSIPASFAHLLQVAAGLEWKAGQGLRMHPSWRSLVVIPLVTLVVAWASAHRRQVRTMTSNRDHRAGPRGIRVGFLWTVMGVLPIMAAAPVWSAHHYLFALCGLALLVGAWAARQARWLGPSLVTLAALASQNTRGLESVAAAPGAWTTQSHVNRFSLMREMGPATRYADEIKRLRPTLSPNSTLFFAGVPNFWDAGGGPLVRTAYHDTSLRAYDLTVFTLERARRGPVVFVGYRNDRLCELSSGDLRDLAVDRFRATRATSAHEALVYSVEQAPDDWLSRYWLAWVEWSRGDSAAAFDHLETLGMKTRWSEPFTWEKSWSQRTLAAGDTAQALDLLNRVLRRQALDPEPHKRLAQVLRGRADSGSRAEVEDYAARVLINRPPARPATSARTAARAETPPPAEDPAATLP